MSVTEPLENEALKGDKMTAIYIAALAVMLAVCSVGGDNATKTMIKSSIDATDTYGFYQSKNNRQTVYALAADELELELMNPALSENARKYAQEKLTKYRATAERYESEPATGEGKKELLPKATAFVAERDVALRQDPYFDFGEAMLQIAIVLASASIILGGTMLLWGSGIVGIFGVLATINGYTLLVNVPFLS